MRAVLGRPRVLLVGRRVCATLVRLLRAALGLQDCCIQAVGS